MATEAARNTAQEECPFSGPPAALEPVNGQSREVGFAIPESLQGFTGGECLTQEDLIIPRYKIVQPTSKTGNPGTFLCNLTGEETESLHVAVVKIHKGRIMWDKENPSREEPLCRSYDYMTPDPSIKDPPSPLCAKMIKNPRTGKDVPVQVCKMGSWEGDERPPCGTVYNLLCISLDEDGLPFWITLHGASIKAVKNYASSVMLRRKPFWVLRTTLTLALKTEPHRHYVAQFSMPKAISPEMEEEIVPQVDALKDADVRRTFEAEEAAAMEWENREPGADEAEDPDKPTFMKG